MNLFKTTHDLPEVIFRAYDIRGVVNETLTADVVFTIAKSIAAEAREQGQNSIVVGRDGRLTSPLFGQAVIAGLLESGIDVIDIGRVPTPLLYFATHFLLSTSGIMVTGSHNPANYNGLKVVIAGKTLADEGIKKLYHRALQDDFAIGQGQLTNVNINQAYISRIVSDVHLSKPLKIVIDAGNGITGKIAPDLFRQMGCQVSELFCEIDGDFPNHHPDPSQEKNLVDLINKVKEEQADIGLAFDGDGDRLGVITNKGEIIWPDRQMMCFAIEILERCKGATILFDVKCSKFLSQVISEKAGIPLMWKTGHSYIKNKMKEVEGALGGEMSGHIFFKDRWYGFDDALYSGARLLEIISQAPEDVATFFAALPNSVNTPELQIPISENEKFSFMEKLAKVALFPDATINSIDGLRVDFSYGFGLIRPSNTTPNLVLRFEADSEKNLKVIQNAFKDYLLAVNPALVIPF
ncbi:MAG: phosphomannomutase/phosphoglucomutase [Gammaproteobacteria bacterium]|nr:phosphomannomutase/phosphoglucomutase [Gammaproteobacteria bacterium]